MLVKNINFVNYLKEVCWRGHMTTIRQMYEKKEKKVFMFYKSLLLFIPKKIIKIKIFTNKKFYLKNNS